MTLLLLATIVLVVAVITAVQLLADLRFRRMRPTRIADCRHGQLVKVVGTAVAIGATRAPFSERPCVAWRIAASTGQHKNARIVGRAHIDKFIVNDASGEATVDPEGVSAIGHGHLRLASTGDASTRWTTADDRTLPGLALLDLARTTSASEAIVAVGARVAVRARVAIDGTTIRLVADRGKHMIVTDQPRLIGR